jgi:hypothetical protein
MCVFVFCAHVSEQEYAGMGAHSHRKSSGNKHAVDVKDTTSFATKSTIKLTLPLLLVITWFIVMYFLQRNMTEKYFSDTAGMYTVQQLSYTSLSIIQYALAPIYVSSNAQ